MLSCQPVKSCACLSNPLCQPYLGELEQRTTSWNKLLEDHTCEDGKFCCKEKEQARCLIKGECDPNSSSLLTQSNIATAQDCLDKCENVSGKSFSPI